MSTLALLGIGAGSIGLLLLLIIRWQVHAFVAMMLVSFLVAFATQMPIGDIISTLDYLAQFLKGATRVTRANEARRTDFADAVTHEHTQIVLAIVAGDPVAARAAAAQHMKNALARIEQADLTFWAQDGARLAQPLVAASTPLVF